MNNEAFITVNQARALCMIAPKSDVRYYLNGVLVNTKTGRLVVTDGHRLLSTKAETANGSESFIVPREALYNIAKGGKVSDRIGISLSDAGVRIARENGIEATVPPIDGRYPEIDRVIPDTVSGEVAQFNCQYLAECAKAITMCDGVKFPHLAHNGLGAAIMSSDKADTFAVIMPTRIDNPSDMVKFEESTAKAA